MLTTKSHHLRTMLVGLEDWEDALYNKEIKLKPWIILVDKKFTSPKKNLKEMMAYQKANLIFWH